MFDFHAYLDHFLILHFSNALIHSTTHFFEFFLNTLIFDIFNWAVLPLILAATPTIYCTPTTFIHLHFFHPTLDVRIVSFFQAEHLLTLVKSLNFLFTFLETLKNIHAHDHHLGTILAIVLTFHHLHILFNSFKHLTKLFLF